MWTEVTPNRTGMTVDLEDLELDEEEEDDVVELDDDDDDEVVVAEVFDDA